MAGVIYDQNGNIIGTSKNINNFVTNKSGEIINPSTQEILQEIKNEISTTNTKFDNISKENTLQIIKNKLEEGLTVTLSSPIQNVNVVSSALPLGAATENTLNSINSKIETTSKGIKVDTSHIVQEVNVISSVLPENAAKDSTLTDGSAKFKVLDSNGNILTSTNGSLNVNVKRIDADIDLNYQDDEVRVYGSSNNPIKTDELGNLEVKVISSTLPSGAATEATLAELNSKITGNLALENGNLSLIKQNTDEILNSLDDLAKQSTLLSIDSKIQTTAHGIKVDASGTTIPISAQSLPLPNGAATEFKQDLILAKLDTLNDLASEYTLSLINNKINVNPSGAIKVDASSSTVPVNVISLPLPTGAARDVTLTNGTQITKILDSNGNSLNSTNGSLNVSVTQRPTINPSSDAIRIYGTNGSQAVPIAVDSYGRLILPSDAATSSKQDVTNTYLNNINSILNNLSFQDGKLKVDSTITLQTTEIEIKNDAGNPIPIYAQSLPLPEGAATSVKQDTTNNLLSQLNNNFTYTFSGTRVLGYNKILNDFSRCINYFYRSGSLAANATVTVTVGTVPSTETWHLKRIFLSRSIIISTNNTAISRLILRANTVEIAAVLSDGNTTFVDLNISLPPNTVVSFVLTNGAVAAENYVNLIYEIE